MSEETGYPDILMLTVCHAAYAGCASLFLKTHLRGTEKEAWGFGGALFCIRMAVIFFCEREKLPYMFCALLSQGILVCLTMWVFEGEKEKKLLAAAVLTVMSGLIWNFGDSFLCCAWLILTHLLTGGRQSAALGAWEGRSITAVTYAAGIAAVCLLSKPLKPVLTDKRKSWYLFLTIPLFFIALVTDLVNWAASNGIMVQAWGKYGLYENQLFSHGAMCLFTGLVMAAAAFLVFGMDRLDRAEQVREQYRSQVMYYQMMEEEYSRMERLRHDMKNHVIALKNLAQNRQWEKTVIYLEEMAEEGGVEAGDEITGSLVIDALLYHKRRQAQAHSIRWQCDARLPKSCPVKEIDLCIILGNVLDNALEACRKPPEGETPFIQVYLGAIKKCLFLEVRNIMPRDGASEREGLRRNGGETRKERAGGRGLGLGNIQSAAAKYNGAVHVEKGQGVFAISVLLPLYCREEKAENRI